MRLFFLDPRIQYCQYMGGFLASRPGRRLKRGSGFDLDVCCWLLCDLWTFWGRLVGRVFDAERTGMEGAWGWRGY